MTWMREERIEIFMYMELDKCRNGLGWRIRRQNSAADECLEEEYPLRLLSIAPDDIENLQSRLGKAMQGFLPPTIKMIILTYYPLLVRQAPVHPQQQNISS